ncbi:MAG: tripartite tricarboxylate transporter substrate binding protein [Deltaproteobacteria bacterium]|jgi:tripartite-type tricarboxylate transporter receptor subunit TctC|nr:tripartite tricarboxylate transporter substrate binding protein [Deltaproteobacteria bacterium]
MNSKKDMRLVLVLGLVTLLTIGGFISTGYTQAKFPSRPMTIICPWGAGGGTDAVARIVGVLMEKELGQPVNVVNRTGGGGAVGHTAGANAAPDGYTMCLTTVEITMMHWMGMAQVNYKDLKGVALLNFDPAGINVRFDSDWKTVYDLQSYAKANPGKLKASGTGKGGIWDLARAGWLKTAGISVDAIPWVPSNGAAPALQEMQAGGVHVVSCSLPEARALIDAKRVRALAIMAENRAEVFPDVPTLKELGLNWTMGAWRGLTVPKGTPAGVVAVLEKAVEKVLASQQFKEFMQKNGFGIWFKPAAEFDKFLAQEDEVKGKLMKEAGITQ